MSGNDTLSEALRTALTHERIDVVVLESAGVKRWDAISLLQKLHAAGDLRDGAWIGDARERLRSALPPPPTVAKALDRLRTGDRPREKALAGGIEACDDADVLALLLRTGVSDEGVLELAQRLLNHHGGIAGLARLDIKQLSEQHGIGPAKATELAAAFSLGRRVASSALREQPDASSPEAAAALLIPLMSSLGHEELWTLCLNPRNRVLGEPRMVTRGDVDGTDAGPRAVMRTALMASATSCIVAHNHPSGDPSPSASDLAVTRRLAAAGRTVLIEVKDHLIIGTAGRFVSLRRMHPELFA